MKKNTLPFKTILAAVALGLCLITSSAFADAPLKSTLDLDVEQAAKVAAIQKEARDAVRPVRGDLHREERALRRAKLDNDAEAIAKQEKAIEPLRETLAGIFAKEEEQIRALLNPEQLEKYEEYLKERDEMVGSSRDVKEIKKSADKAAE